MDTITEAEWDLIRSMLVVQYGALTGIEGPSQETSLTLAELVL